jgi:hypothetical protein
MRWLVLFALACSRPAPVVRNVTTVIEPMRCDLPALPQPAMVVGFPAGAPGVLELMVTRSDAAEILRELEGMRRFHEAVRRCMEIDGGP